uniref:Dynein axonemal assembly factor 9 n=1 Tax=Scleropages formosus TaxID=113540 RepID=A0A8D0CI52_SCLFO
MNVAGWSLATPIPFPRLTPPPRCGSFKKQVPGVASWRGVVGVLTVARVLLRFVFLPSAGIDSRYNQGCCELAGYLFFGLFTRNHLDRDFQFPEELLDDVILLIKADSVHLYCNPINYTCVLPFVSHWRNLHVHCLTEAEYEDEEAAEEFKISSFVNMVQGCSHIGVPYSPQGYAQKFDMFAVEKWPIIQAFALEGIGGGGFFTMKHKLTDVSEKLWQIYGAVDPVSLEMLLTADLVTFEKQWSSFFSNFDTESYASILELSEAQAGEPFRTYFSHGLISSQINNRGKCRQPFVLFGNHSTKEDLNSYCFTFPSEDHQVRNTGPLGTTAKHMVVQCVSPKGPLACARTYFFGTAHVPCAGTIGIALFRRFLTQVYEAAVQAVLAGIKCFCSTSSVSKVTQQYRSLHVYHGTVLQRRLQGTARGSIAFIHIDTVLRNLFTSSPFFSQASMEVCDIPDPQGGEEPLGSLVFSESFLESRLYVQKQGKTRMLPEQPLELGTFILHSALFLILSRLHYEAQYSFKVFGSPKTLPRCCLLAVVFFSEGVLFVHPHCGILINVIQKGVFFCLLRSCSLRLRQDSSHTVSTLFLDYKSSLLPHLPLQLRSTSSTLAFALQTKTKAPRSFRSQVGMLQNNMRPFLSILFFLKSQFLQHFALSSMGQKPVQSKHLEALFGQKEPARPHNSQADKVCMFCCAAGWPGQCCVAVIHRWAVYHPTLESGESFCHVHFQRYLTSVLQSQMGNRVRQSTVSHCVSRLLVITPGYTDVVDVVQALLTHPDPETREAFGVGAVTACIDPLSSYMEHRYLFPKLLEQCSHGLVSTVVFTGLTQEPRHRLLVQLQQLVRAANPGATFILAEKGAVTRNEDIERILSESSFSEPEMLRVRYLLYPGLNEGKFCSGIMSPIMSHQCVTFNRPLDRLCFAAKCKELKSSLKPNPFSGNIYYIFGTVRFSDLDTPMEVNFSTLSGTLSLVPALEVSRHPTQSCFLQFEGVDLTQEGLKDWLRQCTQRKPAKKALKTKKTLTLQEIRMIHVEHHLDPLSTGYFYNGNQFMNFGEKMSFHPLMERFIDQYVERANKEIESFNQQLEQQGQWDLFDP